MSVPDNGLEYDRVNDRVNLNYGADPKIYADTNGVTVPSGETLTVSGTLSASGAVSTTGVFGLGTAEQPTIASGVLTVTQSHVDPQPESSTTDTVDSIVVSGKTVAAGDILLIHVPATNTITFDDANINLAAATRDVAPGGSLLLVYDGTQWSEVTFTTATDNS